MMATHVTHIAIGERVYLRVRESAHPIHEKDYGSFLLGCILADVNNFNGMDRRKTHFVGSLEEDGADAVRESCGRFLAQLEGSLARSWSDLNATERAFVAGYLCHIAADEAWKLFGWRWLKALGIASLNDFPVPVGVVVTAFDTACTKTYRDFPAIALALEQAAVPEVFTHVPYRDFVKMWNAVREHVLDVDGRTPESYFGLIERMDKDEDRIQRTRQQHEAYWGEAMSLLQDAGGIEPVMQAAVERSMKVLPRLWNR
jgi:hypothetical protein